MLARPCPKQVPENSRAYYPTCAVHTHAKEVAAAAAATGDAQRYQGNYMRY